MCVMFITVNLNRDEKSVLFKLQAKNEQFEQVTYTF